VLHVRVRFLQLQRRSVERLLEDGSFAPADELATDDGTVFGFDEAVEHEVDLAVPVAAALDGERATEVTVPGGRTDEDAPLDGRPAGRLARERWPLRGVVRVRAEELPGPYGVLRVRVGVENLSAAGPRDSVREDALRRAFVATHVLLGAEAGRFLSLLEPPEWARPYAEGCTNVGSYPVLVGSGDRDDLVLSSPIILYDHPQIAPESGGDLFDALEIDEILLLRTMTLTDEEKAEARATDPRAAAIIDRADTMPAEMLDKLHGAVRYLRGPTGSSVPDDPVPTMGNGHSGGNGHADGGSAGHDRTPWWDPGSDSSVSPETDAVTVAGLEVRRGSRVILRPGSRSTDAQDMFLRGRSATVEAVLHDVDGNRHVAVTVDDDPGAELQKRHGRFLYFAPDEIEPLEAAG
jgi:hypothetical protein